MTHLYPPHNSVYINRSRIKYTTRYIELIIMAEGQGITYTGR